MFQTGAKIMESVYLSLTKALYFGVDVNQNGPFDGFLQKTY